MIERFRNQVVLSSTPNSIENGKVSLLAVAEVLLAICAYWAIAVYFQTQLHILISLIALPLLLLRSDESCCMAKRWWGNPFRITDEDAKARVENLFKFGKPMYWLVLVVSFAVSLIVSGYLAIHLLIHYDGQRLFWRAFLLGLLILNIPLAVAGVAAVAVAATGAATGAAAGVGAAVVAAVVAGVVAVAGAGAGTGVVAVAGVLAAAGAVAGARAGAVLLPGFCIGFVVAALSIRFSSVIAHPIKGFRQWRTNWSRTMLYEDFRLEPALIPGIGSSGVTLSDVMGDLKFERALAPLSENVFALMFGTFIWVPAQLWRWSIKSTVWFYGPLYLLLNFGAQPDKKRRTISLAARPSMIGWMSFAYSTVVVLITLAIAIDWTDVIVQWFRLAGDAPFTVLGWWLVIDWSKLTERPWQWFHLPAVVLTIVCFLWLDWLRRQRESAKSLNEPPDQFFPLDAHPGRTIYWLQRFQWCLAVAAGVVGIGYFAKVSYLKGTLPAWLTPVMETIV